YRVIADDFARTHHCETDAARGPPSAAIGRQLFGLERAAARGRDHFAHAPGGPRGRIDFVAVMRLDDIDIERRTEHARCDVEQLEAEIDADAHIGREHDAYALGGFGDAR